MRVFLDTIGCRLNQSEIEMFARQLQWAGHTVVDNPSNVDLAIINTCAVTAAAESDSRQKIRQATKAKAHKLVVTGCWVSLYPSQAETLPGVTRVVPNLDKEALIPSILNLPAEVVNKQSLARQPIPGIHHRTRAFIKVQDGCNNRCTYCITSLARGPQRSRQIADILKDVHAAWHSNEIENGGANEVILTGVHLGAWGRDFAKPLSLYHLVQAILDNTKITRLRLSSLEPWDLEDNFLRLWENPRLCQHIHLPLQSGCGDTLLRMARKTTPDSYEKIVEQIRSINPAMAITTDIITGFPGENETEFNESLEFVREMRFAGGHVFPYSARPGTLAARMSAQVPHPIRKLRSKKIREVLSQSAWDYQSQFIGQVLNVLWVSAKPIYPQNWQLTGRTDNNLIVFGLSSHQLWNQITPVRLRELTPQGIFGELLSK